MAYSYQIIVDNFMMANIMQTNVAEVMAYLNVDFFMWLIFLGLLPSVILFKIEIIHYPLLKDIISKIIAFTVSCLIALILIFTFYTEHVKLARNYFLTRIVVPFSQVYTVSQYVGQTFFIEKPAFKQIGLDARRDSASEKKKLFILVIGEAARGMNYELNGYDRSTNQYTKPLNPISFQNVHACGTSTAVSIPCLFSKIDKKSYSAIDAIAEENVLDILQRAGVQVSWFDNDGGCKGVCRRIPTVDLTSSCHGKVCFDQVLLDALKEKIPLLEPKDTLIVLHLIGSHGPRYYERYPAEHRYFRPECQQSDIYHCTKESLMNAYDNSILYTDYLLSKMIQVLKEQGADWETMLLYVSDHGESLGENGWYFHGAPPIHKTKDPFQHYAQGWNFQGLTPENTPKEQIQVPLIVWFSEQASQSKRIDRACLKHEAKNNSFSHDYLFHSILGIMDVSTEDYDASLDMFEPCRKE